MLGNYKVKNKDGLVMKGGGIVVKEEGGQKYILMIFRALHDDWSFPRGHTEHNETVQDTVIREVKEECGIDVEIIRELLPNKYLNTRNNEETICHMFLVKPTTSLLKLEHKGDKVEWVQANKVIDKISNSNLRDYFRKIIRDI